MSVDVTTVWFTTLVLASSAFAVAFLSSWFRDRYIRPSLHINFEFGVGSVCSHQTEMYENEGLHYPVYYFSFVVANEGRSHAEDCEAILEKVWKMKDEECSGVGLISIPVDLMWAPGGSGDRVLKTIPREGKRLCNIGHIRPHEHQPDSVYRGISEAEKGMNKFFFELPSNQKFFYQWDCLVPGEYLVQISVYAKNAKKVRGQFRISWSGEWKPTEKEMFRKIVVSPLGQGIEQFVPDCESD